MSVRGRTKPPPWNLAGLGVRGLVVGVVATINHCELDGYSAQLAYYFFLSLFPTLLFLASLLSYLPLAQHHHEILLTFIGRALPKQAMALVRSNLNALLSTHKGGLLSFGALFALYTAGNALIAASTGLNRVFGVRERRSFLHVRAEILVLTLALGVLLVVAVTLFFFGPRLVALLAAQFGWTLVPAMFDIIRWPVILGTLLTSTALVYHFAPNIRQHWYWITPGSLFAVTGWLATSALFAFYVGHFGSYNRTYGSIGAVIVLLTWMYLSGWMLFVGGSINAVLAAARTAQLEAAKSSSHTS